MKKILIMLWSFLLLSITAYSQSENNLAKVLKQYSEKHPNELVIVYCDLQWCGGSMKNSHLIFQDYEKVNECNRIVMLTTNFYTSNYKDTRIDTVINVKDFYAKGLRKSEMKRFSKQVNDVFNTQTYFYNFGPSSFNVIKNGTYIEFFNNFSEESIKSKYYCK